MRKLLLTFSLVAGLIATPVLNFAENEVLDSDTTVENVEETVTSETNEETTSTTEDIEEDQPKKDFKQIIKNKFVEGGVEFMSAVIICLILGLAIAIERIIILNLATTNTKNLLKKVKDSLKEGGVAKAQDMVSRVKGPVASIFSQGLMRSSEGIENVEKSIISYGSVEMGKLEKGLSWISLFIAIAPLLGFMGTVIGMISAFDSIMTSEGIEIAQVAKGIKEALLTTVAGLIVAIILQIFYNYCLAKVDSIVNQMEDASISFVDTLIAYKENN